MDKFFLFGLKIGYSHSIVQIKEQEVEQKRKNLNKLFTANQLCGYNNFWKELHEVLGSPGFSKDLLLK